MRQVREELGAFSPAFRRALEAASLSPGEVAGPAQLARVAPLSRAELARSGAAHVLVLDPRAIRDRWSGLRKLAFSLGGRRVREALPRSYRPALRLETRGRAGPPLAVWLTAFDVEVARELGLRNLELFGLTAGASRALALVGGGTDLASWQVRLALEAAGVPAACVAPPRGRGAAGALRAARDLRPTAVLGAPADVSRLARAARGGGVRLESLDLVVLLAEPADAARRVRIADELRAAGAPDGLRFAGAYGLAEGRTLFVECPTAPAAPSGLHLFPDAVLAECEEAARGATELLLTPLVGHGTAVYRYRTGDRVPGPASWAPCPACGRGLPRVGPIPGRLDEDVDLGAGARLDFASLRRSLDARPELLEWQLLVRPGAEGAAAGLLLRCATVDGSATAPLLADLRASLGDGARLPPLELGLHSEQEMLDFLATPHEMLERRLLDPAAAEQP